MTEAGSKPYFTAVAGSADDTRRDHVKRVLGALVQLFVHHLKIRLEYRQTFLFSLVLHPLVMLLISFMFRGIYAHHDQQRLLGYTLAQMVWYFGASQFFYYLVWNIVDKNISERVLYGGMDQQLTRPYSMLTWEFAQLVSHKLLSFALEFVPVFLLYTLVWTPDFLSVAGVTQYLIATALASVQFFLMSFILGALAFVFQDVSSANAIKFIIVNVFAGVALPIAFFPNGLEQLILNLPFHYLFHTPVSYLLGTAREPGWQAFCGVMLGQCFWLLVLLLAAELVHRRTLRHFVSAGG